VILLDGLREIGRRHWMPPGSPRTYRTSPEPVHKDLMLWAGSVVRNVPETRAGHTGT